jgi:hypothetical protein
MSFREPNGVVMTANMKLLGWKQATKEKKQKLVSGGWMQRKQFWLPAQGEVFFA